MRQIRAAIPEIWDNWTRQMGARKITDNSRIRAEVWGFRLLRRRWARRERCPSCYCHGRRERVTHRAPATEIVWERICKLGFPNFQIKIPNLQIESQGTYRATADHQGRRRVPTRRSAARQWLFRQPWRVGMRWREGAGERDEPGTNGRLGTTDRRRERERASEWREREREPASGEEEWKGFGERGSSEKASHSKKAHAWYPLKFF